MTRPAASKSLTIFLHGNEVPGLIAYGLRTRGNPAPAQFPAEAWATGPEHVEFTLIGDAWEVKMWEFPLTSWPSSPEMETALAVTLSALIHAGCRVAWVGAEGVPFCDPPDLFEPEYMSGAVLAWMTDDGAADCRMDPTAPIATAGDDTLLALRAYAAGLADVS